MEAKAISLSLYQSTPKTRTSYVEPDYPEAITVYSTPVVKKPPCMPQHLAKQKSPVETFLQSPNSSRRPADHSAFVSILHKIQRLVRSI